MADRNTNTYHATHVLVPTSGEFIQQEIMRATARARLSRGAHSRGRSCNTKLVAARLWGSGGDGDDLYSARAARARGGGLGLRDIGVAGDCYDGCSTLLWLDTTCACGETVCLCDTMLFWRGTTRIHNNPDQQFINPWTMFCCQNECIEVFVLVFIHLRYINCVRARATRK